MPGSTSVTCKQELQSGDNAAKIWRALTRQKKPGAGSARLAGILRRRDAAIVEFGDLVTFNPHIHVLAADGLFRADGVFVALPAIPIILLEQGFRCEVLELLVAEHAIGERLSASMLAWRHIPDRFEHLVRYVAWYSTRCRGPAMCSAARSHMNYITQSLLNASRISSRNGGLPFLRD